MSKIFFFLMFLLPWSAGVLAQDQGTLDKVTLEIQKKEADLKDAKIREEKATKEHAELLHKQKELQGKLAGIDLKKKETQKEQELLQEELMAAEVRYREMLFRFRQRLRVMYTKSGGISLPARNSKSEDRSLFFPYALSIANHDKQVLSTLQSQVQMVSDTKARIALKFDSARKLDEEARENFRLVKEEAVKAEQAKKLIAKERAGIDKALAALKVEAAKVSAVIEQITKEDPKPVVQPSIWKKEDPEDLDFKPVDIFSPSVKVSAPVQGQVVKAYGTNRLEKFDDMLLSKGIEYKTAPKGEVRAIAGGHVAYVGQLPGYGLVVIVDHGAHAHTLYARLSESKVSVQRVVTQNQVIGLASEPDDEKRNFYFEVRQNGKPVDPEGVLKKSQLH